MKKSISISTRSSKATLLTQTIKPNRFIWHVKLNDKSSDLSIAVNGLICKENYAVFAHNGLKSFGDMYPYILDVFDFTFASMQFEAFDFINYSYWRIDTSALDFTWYIDPFMRSDHKVYCTSNASFRNFICTPNTIPPHALQLFVFDLEKYSNEQPFISYGNGVASVRPRRTDFDSLVVEKKVINDFKDWKIKNAQAKVA